MWLGELWNVSLAPRLEHWRRYLGRKSEKKRTEMLADEEMVVKMEDREDSIL